MAMGLRRGQMGIRSSIFLFGLVIALCKGSNFDGLRAGWKMRGAVGTDIILG